MQDDGVPMKDDGVPMLNDGIPMPYAVLMMGFLCIMGISCEG